MAQSLTIQGSKGLVNMSNEESVKTRRGIKVYNSNPFLQSGMVKPKTKHHQQARRLDGGR